LAVYHQRKRLAHSLKPIASPPIPISSASQLHVAGCVLNFDSKPPQSSLDATTFNSSHHWLFSSPLASLNGRLEFNSARFDFDGVPVCRDHRYGPALPRPRYILDGLAFLHDSAIFFLATPTTSWMIRAGRDGIYLIDQPVTVQFPRSRSKGRGGGGLNISLGDLAILSRGSPIDLSRAVDRFVFDPPPNESIHAFCEFSNPRLRRWPLEVNWFTERPQCRPPILTYSPLPPTDKSSPSAPEHAPAPSSSP
jgi:hypothetical protein